MSETIFKIKTVADFPEGTILFTKRPSVCYGLGPARPHPTDPMKAVADLIVEYEIPDLHYCAVAINIGKL